MEMRFNSSIKKYEIKNEIYFDSLDFLRWMGACAVDFFWHWQNFGVSRYPFDSFPPFHALYRYAFVFVEMFFAMSGFVMAHRYGSKIGYGKISFFEYIKKRIIHLYPLQIITLLVITAENFIYISMTGFPVLDFRFDAVMFIENLFMVQEGWITVNVLAFNAPAWQISVELFCYIVFFIILSVNRKLFLNRIPPIWIYFVMVILSLMLRASGSLLPLLNVKTARGMCAFFFGAAMKEIYDYCKTKTKEVLGLVSLTLIIFILLLGCIADFSWIINTGLGIVVVLLLLWTFVAEKHIREFFSMRLFKMWGGVRYTYICGGFR